MSSIAQLLRALAREREAYACKTDFIPGLLRVIAGELEDYTMPVIYSASVHTARSTVVRDAIDGAGKAGQLQLVASDNATVLANITLGYPGDATATIVADTLTFTGFPRTDASIDATGIATYARLTDGNGKVIVDGMTVGTSDADIVLDTVSLKEGNKLTIDTARLGNITPIVPPPAVLPVITTIAPNSGEPGTSVSIAGTAFGTTPGTVKFGTVTATVVSWTDTLIVCTSPTTTGSQSVKVTNASGTSNGANFTYIVILPPVGTREAGSYNVWPNYVVKGGADCIAFSNNLQLRWKNVNGDWLDANQTPQGTTPWYTLVVPKNSIGYIDYDITALVQRWQAGENRGAYFFCDNTSNDGAWVRWCGTYGENPPQLVVTRSGNTTVTIRGDLCGFAPASATAKTPPLRLDTGLEARLSRQSRQVIHFQNVNDITGTITSATMRLYANSTDDIYPLNIKVFETDPPPLLLGGAGGTPIPGLALEVGEENLAGHPDVLMAGDFREVNWNATPGVWKDQSLGTGLLFGGTQMSKPQYLATQVLPDPDHPGRFYLRTCIATGQIGGGEFKTRWHRSGPAETGRMPDPATYEGDIYVRCEVWLEQDSFWSSNYAFKFSPVGQFLEYGKGEEGGGWNGDSIWQWGHGQTSSDGKRHWNEQYQQWILQGHSCRGHLLGWPNKDYTAYPGAVAVGFAPSHLGPYDTLRDGGLYGTEQNIRIGVRGQDHCIPMNRWVTMESHVRVNTIDMSVLDSEGNGVARNDGVLEVWLDGVHVGGRYDMAWQQHPSMGVSGHWLMAYHGGNTPTDHDIWWRVRNFCVARRYIGPAR